MASAHLAFGDLPVFTGPQASGKSIALQTLRLALDQPSIVHRMADQGLTRRDGSTSRELYFGAGMTERPSLSAARRPVRGRTSVPARTVPRSGD